MSHRGRFNQLFRELTGRADADLVGFISEQLGVTLRGAELAREVIDGRVVTGHAREEIRAIEHTGDQHRATLIREMSRSLTTPIDREDLFRLSRSIDDVLDNLRDFVREVDLFAVDGMAGFTDVIDAVVEGIEHLDTAVLAVTGDASAAADQALSAKKASSQIRRRYQVEVSRVLEGHVDSETLKRRELLRRLDIVGLRLGEAADALADGLIKRSH